MFTHKNYQRNRAFRSRAPILAAGVGLGALLLLAGAVAGTPAPPAERPGSAAELQAFLDFYHRQEPASPPVTAGLRATRPPGARQWLLSASTDTAPRHSAPGICWSRRASFRQAEPDRHGQRWRVEGAAADHVWLAGDGVCTASTRTVRLARPPPQAMQLRLLREHEALLARARLLLAGNTQCARLRAQPFRLMEMDAGPSVAGAPAMYALLFQSARGDQARIEVRVSGAELTAWNVSCPGPGAVAR